jgi:hypothetical protein
MAARSDGGVVVVVRGTVVVVVLGAVVVVVVVVPAVVLVVAGVVVVVVVGAVVVVVGAEVLLVLVLPRVLAPAPGPGRHTTIATSATSTSMTTARSLICGEVVERKCPGCPPPAMPIDWPIRAD